MCNSTLSLKVLRVWRSTYSEQRDQLMRKVVAYKKLKIMENYKRVSSNNDRGGLSEVVAYERF